MKPINWYIYSSCAIYERVPFGWKSHSIFVCMWCTNTHTHTHPRHTNWSRYFLLFCDFHSYRFISSGDNDHHHRHHRHCSSTLHSYVLVNNKKEPHVFFPISDIYRSTPVDILNRTHCRVHRILSSFFFFFRRLWARENVSRMALAFNQNAFVDFDFPFYEKRKIQIHFEFNVTLRYDMIFNPRQWQWIWHAIRPCLAELFVYFQIEKRTECRNIPLSIAFSFCLPE